MWKPSDQAQLIFVLPKDYKLTTRKADVRILMSSKQKKEDEVSSLTFIYFIEELIICEKGGVFYANVHTPASFVVTGVSGTHDVLKHLPPLTFRFTLPPGYPDEAPPSFILSGNWLTIDCLSRLCKRLDEFFQPGQEVLFTWFRFLQEETWSFLQLSDTLSIAALESQGMEGKRTRRDVQSQRNNENNVSQDDQLSLGQQAGGTLLNVNFMMSPNDIEAGGEGCEILKNSRYPIDCEEAQDCGDSRAMVEAAGMSLRHLLIEHSNAKVFTDFNRSVQECQVCFVSYPGTQSVLFMPCGHVACRECATMYLRQATIRDAAVMCPGFECSVLFPHHLIRELLSDVEFVRYDTRLLETALSFLADIVRCPRRACQYPVTYNSEDRKLATCFNCRFSFCVDCRQGYHGVEPCRFSHDEQQRLLTEYREGDAAKRATLEKCYGKHRLRVLIEMEQSKIWLEDNSKSCPHCKASIEKAKGCNKMVCWRCNTHFCWLCTKELDPSEPYNHFLSPQSPCHQLLFHGQELDENFLFAEIFEHM